MNLAHLSIPDLRVLLREHRRARRWQEANDVLSVLAQRGKRERAEATLLGPLPDMLEKASQVPTSTPAELAALGVLFGLELEPCTPEAP